MDELSELTSLLAGRRTFALVGAGCSTESGIPDYRGPETARRARNPMLYRAFVDDEDSRRRYWARSSIGWLRIASARPNAAHTALSDLEAQGRLAGLVTQNVDGLHQAAGSRDVIELHGALHRVVCLDCRAHEPRADLQERLRAANPGFEGRAESAPDGDAELAESAEDFVVPSCRSCGGVLKPDVVFFGENVPRDRVDTAYARLAEADAVLVVGSSLQVFSGYRFVKRASERGLPIGIVNLGPTRGDAFATVRADRRAGEILPALAEALRGYTGR